MNKVKVVIPISITLLFMGYLFAFTSGTPPTHDLLCLLVVTVLAGILLMLHFLHEILDRLKDLTSQLDK